MNTGITHCLCQAGFSRETKPAIIKGEIIDSLGGPPMAACMLTRKRIQVPNTVQEASSKAEGLDIPWEFFVCAQKWLEKLQSVFPRIHGDGCWMLKEK